MVKFCLFLSSLFIFWEGVGVAFDVLPEDTEASFPGAPSKTLHLSPAEWHCTPISGTVTVAKECDCEHRLGPESHEPPLYPQPTGYAGRQGSGMRRVIPSGGMGMLGRQSQGHLMELNVPCFTGIITAKAWDTS